MTADQARHRRLAHTMHASSLIELAGIIVERKPHRSRPSDDVLRAHREAWTATEQSLLGDPPEDWPEAPRITVDRGGLDEAVTFINVHPADVSLLFGTSIVRGAIADRCRRTGAIANLHLGLAPWYRGSATNFWAVHDGRPDLVGWTLHVATDDVDAGDIIAQGQPLLDANDDVHSIGVKAMWDGFRGTPHALHGWMTGVITPRPQNTPSTPARRRAQLDADAVRHVARLTADGLFRRAAHAHA